MRHNYTVLIILPHTVYIRGGSILATQEMRLTTTEARATPWSILVALDTSNQASGLLYLDDGESVSPSATKIVTFSASVSAKSGGLTLKADVEGSWPDQNALASVTVMGLSQAPGGRRV